MLSVLIASRMETNLQKTIDSVLNQAKGEIEVIVVLDGYWPNPVIVDDKRVTIVHFAEPIGQRQAINRMVDIAKGDFIMKLDAHCAMGESYDTILTETCQDDWIVSPRHYDLDTGTWCRRGFSIRDYMFLTPVGAEGGALRAKGIKGKLVDNDAPMIDDLMVCQGSCFVMKRDRFIAIDGLDEGHGSLGWLGCEIACKAWLSGGALKVNKNTWYAHWQKGTKGHRYPVNREDLKKAGEYAVDFWTNNRWPKQIHKFQWLIEKFNGQQ